MKLKLAAICESVRERPDGRIDIIGIFDELHAPAFPAVQERMTVVIIMEWDEDERGEQPFRADLLHANGRKILGLQGMTVVQKSGRRAPVTRLVQELEKVVFPAPGDYHLELVAGGEVVELAGLRLTEQK